MKLSRIAAAGATTALVAASALIFASPASAATTVGDIIFYEGPDVGVENPSGTWPANDWFFGAISGTEGTADFTDIGLAFNAVPGSEGSVQLLNQAFGAQPTNVAELVTILETFEVLSSDDAWTFQLPVFGETGSQFTTLRPVAQGAFSGGTWSNVANTWRTSQSFGAYSAGDTASLEEFANELFAGTAPEFLAYGIFVDPADSPIVRTIEWDGTISGFGPPPTRAVSPTTLTTEQLATTGVTFSGTGWIPGSALYLEIEDSSGASLFSDSSATVVGADGTFSYTLILPDVPVGSYLVVYFDDDDYFWDADVHPEDSFTIEVTATPLPPTGTDLQALVIAAGILLLAGIAITAIRVRRAE